MSPALSRNHMGFTRIRRGLTIPLLLLLAWFSLQWLGVKGSYLLVTPAQVWHTASELFASGELTGALTASLLRYISGFAIGTLAGLAAGLLLGLSSLNRQLFGPTLHTLKQISLFAWIPLIMAWFGLGESSKIIFIALAAFFPALLNTFEGVGSVPAQLVEVARALCFSRWQLIRLVVLPAAVPSIFTGIYLGLIYAWLATLGSEYLLTSGMGLGNILVDGQEQLRMDFVILGIIMVGTIGFLLNWFASLLETYLSRWRR